MLAAAASLNAANDRVIQLEKQLETLNAEHARRISDVKAELLESSQDADRARTQQAMLEGQWRDLQQKYALEKQDKEELKAKLLNFEDERADAVFVRQDVFFV